MNVTIEVLGRAELVKSLETAQTELASNLRGLVGTTARTVKHDAQAAAPVFTGTLRQRIRIRTSGGGLFATVRSAAPHSWLVHRGRRPGKMPPTGKLAYWAIARGIPGKEFVIARAIARKGTKGGVPFLDQAWDLHRPGFIIAIEQLFRQFTDRMARG